MTEVLYFKPIAQNGSGFPISLLAILFLSGIILRKAKLQARCSDSIVSADLHKGAFPVLWVEV